MRTKLGRREFLGAALATAAVGGMSQAAQAGGGARAGKALNQKLLDDADAMIAKQVGSGEVAAAAWLVRRGEFELARAYGKARNDTPFLIASITKPMTATAAMTLRDRGRFALSDPVKKFLPRFTGGDRDRVTIKHLLTHTSGLPDMLPDNDDLRKRHAPLSAFVEGTYTTPLLFAPGTKVSYQSMGILLLATIVEQLAGKPLPAFMAETVFTPLEMQNSSLGLGGRKAEDMAQCQVPEPSDWDWNSAYWRNLGAPWGGAHSTVHDIAAFLENFTSTAEGPLRPKTRHEMCTLQTHGLNGAWGLGWSRATAKFSAACSHATFGHSGSTGTLAWHDPETKVTFVLLTTKPAAQSNATLIGPVSDLVARSAKA